MKEMKHYNEYKYILINENVQQTVNKIIKIIDHNLLIDKNQKLLVPNIFDQKFSDFVFDDFFRQFFSDSYFDHK